MIKTSISPFLFLIIISFIIALSPVSFAEHYGTVQGRAIDRNGNPIAGVEVVLQNGDSKTVGNVVTNAKGEFSFSPVSMALNQGVFRLKASIESYGKMWSSETAFFNVMAMRLTTQDIHFDTYPPSGFGGLYGVVTSDAYMIVPVPATVYLDNGMFFLYPGGRYDQWSFDQLPQGQYVLWAERNIDGVTYSSKRFTVTVPSDDRAYMPIYLPTKDMVTYHQQPVAMKNVVRGIILQKNGLPCPDARVDLYRVAGSAREPVASTSASEAGQYAFDNVYVNGISAKFLVRVTFEAGGEPQAQDSGLFTVYHANTLGVSHDYNVPVSLAYVNSGSVMIRSLPEGAAVCIDGRNAGYATPYNVSLKAGSHALGLSLDGYYCDNITVQVQPDTAVTISRTLKPSTGNLSLNVSPASVDVYFDGQFVGTGPLTLSKKPAGEHTYVLVCDGYRNDSGTVNIVPGESVTEEIEMVATPGISLAYITYLIHSMIQAIGSIF